MCSHHYPRFQKSNNSSCLMSNSNVWDNTTAEGTTCNPLTLKERIWMKSCSNDHRRQDLFLRGVNLGLGAGFLFQKLTNCILSAHTGGNILEELTPIHQTHKRSITQAATLCSHKTNSGSVALTERRATQRRNAGCLSSNCGEG